ncbi:MAG: apolipoprotein N-acyltransferase [bacterium]
MSSPPDSASTDSTASAARLAWARRALGRWRVPLLAMLSGLLLVGSMPGTAVPLTWLAILVPLLLATEQIMGRAGLRPSRRWLRVFGACWLMGGVWALFTGDWLVNTAHVFGHLPLIVVHPLNLVGHGLLVGAEFFLAAALPFALTYRRPALALVFVPLWCTAVQANLPKLFFWSFGQFMYPLAQLVQAADLVGSAGLDLIYLPLQLVLFAWVSRALGRPVVASRALWSASAGVAALLIAAGVYGQWRMDMVAAAEAAAPAVRVVGIQPNFSLKHLASNPALSPSDRERSITALLGDSSRAVAGMAPVDGRPTIVVWPESVYPAGFFLNPQVRRLTERWAQQRGVHLVLASVDFDRSPSGRRGRRLYGIAVHVPAKPGAVERYRKIFLMPFGETIPFGDWFPPYRRLLKAWIPQISEFTAGTEYTVFEIEPGVRVAPMICYDAIQPSIAQGMAANGANLALVLANLGWFGPTSASVQFEHQIRFRAIENRIPLLFLSQNGRTVLFNALGEPAAEPLPAFTAGALVVDVPLGDVQALFTRIGTVFDRTIGGLALLMLAGILWRRWKK